ncbi:MAG: PAS domain S-box protein [Flavobacterium sp.]|nr:MAG: PAS domain S-box protein [Flavobacterium sp.]
MDIIVQTREKLLSDIVENAPFPIGVYTGPELTIALANKSMIDTWGKGDGVIGKRYTEILPELGNQRIFDQIYTVIATGEPFHAKNQRVDIVLDGKLTPHYFNYSFTPLFDETSAVYGVMNTGVDVTDLNLAQQKVAEAEGRLLLAISSADLGTYETNLVTEELRTSPRFNEIWGLIPPITRQTVSDSLHPDDRAVRETAHNKAIAGCGTVSYEARVRHQDGSMHWVRVNGKVLRDDSGRPTSLLGIVQDISEQKEVSTHLQQLVERRTKDLVRSNEDLHQFAHVVSHDLKEPARKIGIFTRLLQDSLSGSLQQKEGDYISKIQKASDRMGSLIDGILNYSTISTSDERIERIDLNEVMINVLNDLEVLIGQQSAVVEADDLPEIEGVQVMINQLFYNLVNNALKFSREGVSPEIRISWSPVHSGERDYAHIKIIDNGIGIPDGYREKIFKPFERLNYKDKYDGTGLGLALCKKIVEYHHGTIEAEESQSGAEFVVCLPLRQV